MALPAITRPTRLIGLLAGALIACVLWLGVGAGQASAAHLTYCGHGHSGGYDHDTAANDGRYYWVQFVAELNVTTWWHDHRYRHYFHHQNGYNQPLGDYSNRCPPSTPS